MGLSEYVFGKLSEIKAKDFLQNELKFDIIMQNFNSRFGEIDIVAKDECEILHFIEVKASRVDKDGYNPAFRVTQRKYEKILKTIDFYMLKYNVDSFYQLDLLVINGKNIELIENISI